MYVYECVVGVGRFRNLDLHHQGWYSLRFRLWSGSDVSLAYAAWPHERYTSEEEGGRRSEPEVTLLEDSFTSKPILLRYVDETVEIESGCQFRIESESDEAILDVELLFSEGANRVPDMSRKPLAPSRSSFSVVESKRFRLQELGALPEFSYVPVNFEGRYACAVEVFVGSFLFSEKPKISKNLLSQSWTGISRLINSLKNPSDSESESSFIDERHPNQTALFERWMSLLEKIFVHGHIRKLLDLKHAEFCAGERQLQRGAIVRETWIGNDIIIPADGHVSKTHAKVVAALKDGVSRETQIHLSNKRVVDLTSNFYTSPFPVLFDQRYHGAKKPGNFSNKLHVIVLVHGLQGCSHDLRPLKNSLQSAIPGLVFLLAESNQDCTDDDISIMGKRLGVEISRFLKTHENRLKRLSFIAFSLGGLVVRAALPYLAKYHGNFYSFLTLSTPHLGFIGSTSRLVEGGLWLLQKWNQEATALRQLSLTDSDRQDTAYLVTLAEQGGLQNFHHLVFAGSGQDSYAPFDSARVEISSKSDTPLLQYMARKLLEGVDPECLIRLDVHFEITEKNFDSFIGRTAHILFLESKKLAHIIAHSYAFLFS